MAGLWRCLVACPGHQRAGQRCPSVSPSGLKSLSSDSPWYLPRKPDLCGPVRRPSGEWQTWVRTPVFALPAAGRTRVALLLPSWAKAESESGKSIRKMCVTSPLLSRITTPGWLSARTTPRGWLSARTTPRGWLSARTTPRGWLSARTTPRGWLSARTTPRGWLSVRTTPRRWLSVRTTPRRWLSDRTTPRRWLSVRTTPRRWLSARTTPRRWLSDRTTPRGWLSDRLHHVDGLVAKGPPGEQQTRVGTPFSPWGFFQVESHR